LPAKVGTLFDISRLSDPEYEHGLKSGAINHAMKRDDVKKMKFDVGHRTEDLTAPKSVLAAAARNEEERAEYDRKQEEFQATPITAKTERKYTALIKNRKLYEGACELAWEMYFKFRDEHPDCEPLTPDDLAYVGQWTSCAMAYMTLDQLGEAASLHIKQGDAFTIIEAELLVLEKSVPELAAGVHQLRQLDEDLPASLKTQIRTLADALLALVQPQTKIIEHA